MIGSTSLTASTRVLVWLVAKYVPYSTILEYRNRTFPLFRALPSAALSFLISGERSGRVLMV